MLSLTLKWTLALVHARTLRIPPFETNYFLSRETVCPRPAEALRIGCEQCFALMGTHASYVHGLLPPAKQRGVELGTRGRT